LKTGSSNNSSLLDSTQGLWSRWWPHPALGIAILLLDLLTGRDILFPILFVVPVSLAAWFNRLSTAYALAVFLPLGRFLIAYFVDQPHALIYIVINALIRIMVLLYVAYLVSRARLTKGLEERVSGLLTVCAWSHTVKYEGEWISFEQYLKRRFNIDTTHGISPAEAEKVFGDFGTMAATTGKGAAVSRRPT
jgi:hypothetical protein